MSAFDKDIAFTRRVLGKVEGDLKGGDNSVLENQATYVLAARMVGSLVHGCVFFSLPGD
jgi:hypothetical protein